PSAVTLPNVAPAQPNTDASTTWKKNFHGNRRATCTAGSTNVLGVLLSSRQSGGVIVTGPFVRERRAVPRPGQPSPRPDHVTRRRRASCRSSCPYGVPRIFRQEDRPP